MPESRASKRRLHLPCLIFIPPPRGWNEWNGWMGSLGKGFVGVYDTLIAKSHAIPPRYAVSRVLGVCLWSL